jgi:hypothetical protein
MPNGNVESRWFMNDMRNAESGILHTLAAVMHAACARLAQAAVFAAWGTFVGISAGCARPAVNIPAGVRIEGYDEASKRIAANPVKFLEESLEEARKIKAFTATFQRQERLGLLRELKPQENIAAEYRDRPFSVRFTWQDEESEYRQCVYVKGKHDGKVLLLPRKGAMGQPPKTQAYPPSFAMLFAKSRNPITDFGVRRLLERTLDRIAKAEKVGEVSIKLRDPTEIGPDKEPCFYLELRYPAGDPFPCKLQDLYISARTKLPVATYLWLPGKIERCDATLDGMYVYSNLRAVEHLVDSHFKIEKERDATLATNREEAQTDEEPPPPGSAASR